MKKKIQNIIKKFQPFYTHICTIKVGVWENIILDKPAEPFITNILKSRVSTKVIRAHDQPLRNENWIEKKLKSLVNLSLQMFINSLQQTMRFLIILIKFSSICSWNFVRLCDNVVAIFFSSNHQETRSDWEWI